jgi:Protein of unknown function (DUF3179)
VTEGGDSAPTQETPSKDGDSSQEAGPEGPGGKPATLDLRSGGWVLALSAVLMIAVLGWYLPSILGRDGGPPPRPFDLSDLRLPADTVAEGALRDVVPAMVDPGRVSVEEARELRFGTGGHGKYLLSGSLVIGVEVEGEACAYPLRILDWHEVVNDTLGGLPLLVTWSPLTGSPAVFDRRVNGELLEFGVSGLLHQSNLLLYDRRPQDDATRESLWSQLLGQAVSGPAGAAGHRLERVPFVFTHWDDWYAAHPETRVLAPDMERRGRAYNQEPYKSYLGSDQLPFPVDPLPPADVDLWLKAPVIAVQAGGVTRVYPVSLVGERADGGSWETTQGDATLRFTYRPAPHGGGAPAALVEAPPGARVQFAYWFGWYATHPDQSQLAE